MVNVLEQLHNVSVAFEDGGTDRRILGRVGAMLFLCAGAIVAATAPMLSSSALPVLEGSAAVSVIIGLIFYQVPWSRWPRVAMLTQTLSGLVLIGVASRLSGEIDHYLPMFVVAFVFVGLTQTVRTAVLVVPVAVAAFFLGAPDAEARTYVNFLVTLVIAAMIGIILSSFAGRAEESSARLERLFVTSTALIRSQDGAHTVAIMEDEANQLVHADTVVTFLAEHPGSSRFVAARRPRATDRENALRNLPITIDIALERNVIAPVLENGEAIFVDDARNDPRLSTRLVSLFDCGALLMMPLVGEDQHLGVLAFCWHEPREAPRDIVVRSVQLLCGQAGLMLERQRATAQVTTDSMTDPLTGLLNRRAIDVHLESLEPDDALVLIDIDRFKSINDSAGHAAGDRILQLLADCIVSTCRHDDLSGRIGGDEILLVLRRAGDGGARSVLADLHQAWRVEDSATTFSAGIAITRPGEESRQVLARADEALYLAKARGRDRTEVALGA